MKKRFLISLMLALCLMLSLGAVANASAYYVQDAAGVLTDTELRELHNQAEQIADSYGCAPYIIVVDSYKDYGSGGDIYQTAMNMYSSLGLGVGQGKNGLLLLVSIGEREYALATYGSVTHRAFTDYGQQYLQESFVDNFRSNDWAGGFQDYLSTSQWLLQQAAEGTPYDVGNESGGFGIWIVLVPLVIALVVCIVLVMQMKTANVKTEAGDYVNQNGVKMRVVQDFFTHRTVTRRVIERDNGHGGRGGTSVNRGGFSGGKGRF